MHRAFNKYGNIEIEGSEMKYRIESKDVSTDDALELEKDIKRKLQMIENQDRFLLPYDIQSLNRYMVLYYNLANYQSLNDLKELTLENQLSYFISLVELGKTHEKGLIISWDPLNFVVDRFDKSIKALLFETDNLKVYDTPEDIAKTIKDIIITSMTTLKKVVSLPKRNDFIYTDDANIQFVEKLYQMNSLDDLSMYLEMVMLDIESRNASEEELELSETKSKNKLSIRKSVKPKQKKPKQAPKRNIRPTGKKKKTNFNKLYLVLGAVAAFLLLLGPLLAPTTEQPIENVAVATETNGQTSIFKGSKEFDNALVDAYRKAYNSEYTDAYTLLSSINKNDLNDKDIVLLMEVYYQTGNMNLLLDELPALANDVITYLFTRDKLGELPVIAEKMVTKNAYIEFEKAHLMEEYEYMLSLVSSIQINGRKEQQIIDAYLALDQVEEAHKFAEDVGNPDLIKRVEQSKN